jgi:hypothetical protein
VRPGREAVWPARAGRLSAFTSARFSPGPSISNDRVHLVRIFRIVPIHHTEPALLSRGCSQRLGAVRAVREAISMLIAAVCTKTCGALDPKQSGLCNSSLQVSYFRVTCRDDPAK